MTLYYYFVPYLNQINAHQDIVVDIIKKKYIICIRCIKHKKKKRTAAGDIPDGGSLLL